MNIKEILKPTKSKLRVFLMLFSGVNILHGALIFFIAWTAIVVAELSVGFPISFYCVTNCELFTQSVFIIGSRLNVLRLLVNILFWYGIATIIKRNE